MEQRITMTQCLKSLKKYGNEYYIKLLEFHEVEYSINKLNLTIIASYLTEFERKTLSKYENKWTFNLFLRCLERFIKSKKEKKISNRGRSSNSIYKIKYTGMIN